MNSAAEVKRWKAVEDQLNQASSFLLEPEEFHVAEQELEGYRFNLRIDELKAAMLNLEEIAKTVGVNSGFWRAIKQVAETIGDTEKASEYEAIFRKALEGNT